MPKTIFLAKKTPGSATGGYTWDKAGDVIEVPAEVATSLCVASHGDIYEVGADTIAPDPEPEPKKPAPAIPPNDVAHALDVANVMTPKAKRGK